MAERQLPSFEVLRQLLRYEPETGKLFWRERPAALLSNGGKGGSAGAAARLNARDAGKEAFTTVSRKGYRTGSVFGRMYSAHRVVWAIVYESWPQSQIDHIDGDPANNRIANLREATPGQNSRNRRVPSVNTSGVKGVGWHKRLGKWQASIGYQGRNHFLGYFEEKSDAQAARFEAEARLFGEFARQAQET